MSFVFSWAGILGLVASLAAMVLAAVVFGTRPGRAQNRRLGSMLFLDGLAFLGGTGMMYLTDSVASSWAWQAITIFFILATPFAYLLFLATLDTPLAEPLRDPLVEKGLMVGLVLAPFAWFLSPGTFVLGMQPGRYAPWNSVMGPGFLWALLGVVVVSLVGLVLAISAWRRAAAGTARRSQARSYALAFGARDVGLPLTFILVLIAEAGIVGTTARFVAAVVLPAAILLVFVLLLTYGILKTQLFDIDLKIKLGIERSTLAGVFGVTFLAVSEIVERLLGVEGAIYGVVAAVSIGLFFQHIENGAAYVADRLMPGVEDTEAYRRTQKEQIYQAQLEELMADEQVTTKERRALLRLQESLGLDADAANRLEREMLGASRSGD